MMTRRLQGLAQLSGSGRPSRLAEATLLPPPPGLPRLRACRRLRPACRRLRVYRRQYPLLQSPPLALTHCGARARARIACD